MNQKVTGHETKLWTPVRVNPIGSAGSGEEIKRVLLNEKEEFQIQQDDIEGFDLSQQLDVKFLTKDSYLD